MAGKELFGPGDSEKGSRKQEGYVYWIFGRTEYLQHVIASIHSLRRFDRSRPIALVCEPIHHQELDSSGLLDVFSVIVLIDSAHRSIVGFKHNVDRYQIFDRTMFLDSDLIWCKNPDALWTSLSRYPFSITGRSKSDLIFGARKNAFFLIDLVLGRRGRTLRRFGLTELPRIQSGIIYAQDHAVTTETCRLARFFYWNKGRTHFVSRKLPDGSTEESDEWGFAMAMARLKMPVIPWRDAENSPQLDFLSPLVRYSADFHLVKYQYYSGGLLLQTARLSWRGLRKVLFICYEKAGLDNRGRWLTPFSIHFGWKHEKEPFYRFSNALWTGIQSVPVSNRCAYIEAGTVVDFSDDSGDVLVSEGLVEKAISSLASE